MTAAKIMDIIASLPGCDGQAADAVSAYTQEKLEDAPRLLKFTRIRMSRCLDTSSAILRIGKQESGAIVQSLKPLFG